MALRRRFSDDYFPQIERGHGIKHKPFGIQRRHKKQPRCVQHGCKGDDAHTDRAANVFDYLEERGLPSRRAEKARLNAQKLHAAELKRRGTYTPAPRITEEPPYVARVKCSSCGRKPTGQKNDEGLTFGICGRCWSHGYSLKHRKQGEDTQQAAA